MDQVLLKTSRRARDIPENSIILDKWDALHHQYKLIQSWKPASHVYSLKYTVGLLGVPTFFTGIVINNQVRHFFKLRHDGIIGSLCGTTGSSLALLYALHFWLITPDVLLFDQNNCAACIRTKAVLIQNFSAVAYPVIVSPAINVLTAYGVGSIRLPHYTEVRKLCNLWWSCMKSISRPLLYVSVFHTLFIDLLTIKQIKDMVRVQGLLAVDEATVDGEEDKETLNF